MAPARVALGAAWLGIVLLSSCAGGSATKVLESSPPGASPTGSDQAACDDLATLEGMIVEYDELVASGGTDLSGPNVDFGHLRDLTVRLKAVADRFEADAAASSAGASVLQALADSVRAQASNLSQLRGVDSSLLEQQRSDAAERLGCPTA